MIKNTLIITRTGFNKLNINAGIYKADLDFDNMQQMRAFIKAAQAKMQVKNWQVAIKGV